MSSQRYKRDDYAMDDNRQRDRRHRSRSVEHQRRRRRSHSRSRSRSRGYSSRRDKRYTSRHHRDTSKSRSRSKSRSKHYTHSRTPTRTHRHERRTRSRSTERFDRAQRRNIIEHSASDNSKDIAANKSTNKHETDNYLENLPLPNRVGAYYNLSTDEPIDKERIHREMEEKLRQTLAKEGKIYPPPKPEASHPVFANDGSFLEIFKKMQAAQQLPSANIAPTIPPIAVVTPSTSTACYVAAAAVGKSAPPPPIVGRRRGGKILKTGVVAKPKLHSDTNSDPKDFWSLYLAEVNKYKNNACESESGNRPLVK